MDWDTLRGFGGGGEREKGFRGERVVGKEEEEKAEEEGEEGEGKNWGSL